MSVTRLIVMAALAATALPAVAQQAPTAETLMKHAQAKAKAEKKAVWVIFHASW